MYTIDASVFINGYDTTEAGHDLSRRLLELLRTRSIPIIVPSLLLPEVAGSLNRTRGDAARAYTFATALGRLSHLTIVLVDGELAQYAASIAADYRLRGADAIYAAVARRFGTTLITLDNEQRVRAAPLVTAYTPVEALAIIPPHP